ncbi:MAG TPA: hypothetical protein VMI75_14225 [Polyangiaceae bacterium]|nr:hypothetical protein [Polyangiaceae bacterium]
MTLFHEESFKSALLGAAVGAGLGMLLGGDVIRWGLAGGGVGLAKSLLLPEPASGEHRVGALPPGSDYSFTRRPGFNDKNF